MKKNQYEKNELKQVEFGSELNPDDFDSRGIQQLTNEQKNNVDYKRKIDQKASKKTK